MVPLQIRICLNPASCLDDFQRIGGCHKDLHEKLIRIERDRREHLVQLFLMENRLPG
jgi:hypothetical protein